MERIDWESLALALVAKRLEAQLAPSRAASAALGEYAAKWGKRVAAEFEADATEAARFAQKRQALADHAVTYLRWEDGVAIVAIRTPLRVDEEGEVPLPFQLLFCLTKQRLFLVLRPQPGEATYRAIVLTPLLALASIEREQGEYPCVSIGSALSSLYRLHSVLSVHRLHPSLQAVLIEGKRRGLDGGKSPWVYAAGAAGVGLNSGQVEALEGMHESVVMVQGPPGTGKSTLITEAFLRRIPKGSKVLCCTSTNKAIDSLVGKFINAGVDEVITVGSAERMGDVSRKYLLHRRLQADPALVQADRQLLVAQRLREIKEEEVLSRSQKKPKVGVDGREENRGFVQRAAEKLPMDARAVKKTPAVLRLIKILGVGETMSNHQLREAAAAYLNKPPDADDAAAYEALKVAKKELKAAVAAHQAAAIVHSKASRRARKQLWKRVQFVACTAASAVQVTFMLSVSL